MIKGILTKSKGFIGRLFEPKKCNGGLARVPECEHEHWQRVLWIKQNIKPLEEDGWL